MSDKNERQLQIIGRVISEWDSAVDDFYTDLHYAMVKYGWSRGEVWGVLASGHVPDEVADGWEDWLGSDE